MKKTKIESIPVSLPVGKIKDGMDKVGGGDAPSPYIEDKFAHKFYMIFPGDQLKPANVIVKIYTDAGLIPITSSNDWQVISSAFVLQSRISLFGISTHV